MINLNLLDSDFINLTILTDGKTGQFYTKFILGDELDWNRKSAGDPFGIVTESKLLPIKVDMVLHASNSRENEEWEIYPNPSRGLVYIRQGRSKGEVMMKVYDLNGRFKESYILRESLTSIDLSALASGTYLVSLEYQGEVKTKRLIIQQ